MVLPCRPSEAEGREQTRLMVIHELADSSTERRTNRVSSKQARFAGLGVTRMAEVRLQEGESVENALRRFKRKVMTEDIIKDVKRHSFYLKPGERRRVKQALAQKRARKKIRKESDQVAPRRVAAAK
jgi:small subunit ribosomal protein S21